MAAALRALSTFWLLLAINLTLAANIVAVALAESQNLPFGLRYVFVAPVSIWIGAYGCLRLTEACWLPEHHGPPATNS